MEPYTVPRSAGDVPLLPLRYARADQGWWGVIVNMSSVVALRGAFPVHIYTAAEGGVIALRRAMAREYAQQGIRAHVICPGVVLTERVKQRFGETIDAPATTPQIKVDWKQYPFAVGQLEDIARMGLFLASDESRMITDAVIPADGGLSAY